MKINFVPLKSMFEAEIMQIMNYSVIFHFLLQEINFRKSGEFSLIFIFETWVEVNSLQCKNNQFLLAWQVDLNKKIH